MNHSLNTALHVLCNLFFGSLLFLYPIDTCQSPSTYLIRIGKLNRLAGGVGDISEGKERTLPARHVVNSSSIGDYSTVLAARNGTVAKKLIACY